MSNVDEEQNEYGGDAACWASQVCEVCGKINATNDPHECNEVDQ